MKGIWKGYYTYDKERIQNNIGFTKTNFEIRINELNGNQFEGEVEDDDATGGTPGVGKIVGTIENNIIYFVKIMSVKALIGKDGKKYIEEGNHPKLYYDGLRSQDGRSIEGTWRIKFGIKLMGNIPMVILPTKGKFKMEKQ